jgi:hypothetical protein
MFDLLTIVFQEELPLLQIQARTINQYAEYNDIKNIFVVVNDTDSVADAVDINWFGRFANKVVKVCVSQFGADTNHMSGWETQQLYKLLGAALSTSDWSISLDCKTWFIAPLTKAKLFDHRNRANVGTMPPAPAFEPTLEFVCNFYNTQVQHIIGPGGVPHYIHTDTVKSMMQDVERISGQKFPVFFKQYSGRPHLVTEYVLYDVYITYKYGPMGMYDFYNHDLQHTFQVKNIADFEAPELDACIQKMREPNMLSASMHRRTYGLITPEQFTHWLAFLEEKQVIPTVEWGRALLEHYTQG